MISYLDRHYASLVVLTLIFGLGLRLISMNPYGLSFDEQCSLRGALGYYQIPEADLGRPSELLTSEYFHKQTGLKTVFDAALFADRSNGVAHSLFSHFWVKAFGKSDLAVRSSSLLFNMLAFVVLIFGVTRLFGRPTGVLTGITFATHPALVRYAVEFRPYSFAVFFVFVSSFLLIETIKRSNEMRIIWPFFLPYVFSISIFFFSHYLTAYVLLAHFLFCVIYARTWRHWAFMSFAACTLIALFAFWYKSGAAEALKIMAAHSHIWAERQLADGGFTLKKMIHEIKRVVPKLMGLSSFTGYSSPYRLFNVIFHFLKFVTSLAAVVLFVRFIRSKYKIDEKMGFVLVVILSSSAFLYTVLSSIQSRHFVPFMDRYLMFAVALSTSFLSYLTFLYLKQEPNRKWRTLGIVFFVTQMVAALGRVGMESHLQTSYDWTSKNRYIAAAEKIRNYEPKEYTLIFPTRTISAITNVYLPSDYSIDQQIVVPEGQRDIVLKSKVGMPDILIESNLVEF